MLGSVLLVLSWLGACSPDDETSADGGPRIRDAQIASDGGGDDAIATGDTGAEDARAPTDAVAVADAAHPDGVAPEVCGAVADCGPDRRCLAGLCRDECFGLACPPNRSGAICREGLCVECSTDGDCRGGNRRCDPERFVCVEREIDAGDAVIGVMYHQWWTPGRWQGDRGNYVYRPVLGHYDNADQAVIRQHHDWAQRAGVNTWVLDTWITDRDWHWVEPNSRAVMDEADARGMRYFLLIDGWFEFEGGVAGYDTQAIAAKINQRFADWFQRPNYLKVDGKPVVFFWAAWGKPCEVFDAIRAGIEGTLGPIYLTGNNGDPSCWDRVMMYNPYTAESGEYDQQIARQRSLWSDWQSERHPWAPTAMPGYDDTHVRDGNPPVPVDPDFFRRSLETALSYNQHADTPWLFVCSWSEWHEGSNIEPSTDFDPPEVFLDVMRAVLTEAGWLR